MAKGQVILTWPLAWIQRRCGCRFIPVGPHQRATVLETPGYGTPLPPASATRWHDGHDEGRARSAGLRCTAFRSEAAWGERVGFWSGPWADSCRGWDRVIGRSLRQVPDPVCSGLLTPWVVLRRAWPARISSPKSRPMQIAIHFQRLFLRRHQCTRRDSVVDEQNLVFLR